MLIRDLTDRVESVSRTYAERHAIERDNTWFLLKLQEKVGELTQAFLSRTGQSRDKGHTAAELESNFGAELADVLAHTLLIARHTGTDLQRELEQKWFVWDPAGP